MAFAAHLTSPAFKENAKEALADPQLQSALHGIETGIVDRRRAVVARLPEFQALRDSARDIKNHTLAHLDLYLEQFEQRCVAEPGLHHAPRGLRHAPLIVQLVDEVERCAVVSVPAGVCTGAVSQRVSLFLSDSRFGRKNSHMNTPFVLATATSANAIDDQLSRAEVKTRAGWRAGGKHEPGQFPHGRLQRQVQRQRAE